MKYLLVKCIIYYARCVACVLNPAGEVCSADEDAFYKPKSILELKWLVSIVFQAKLEKKMPENEKHSVVSGSQTEDLL